jgi:MFS family permease
LKREPIWTGAFTVTFAAHFFFSLGFWSFVHLSGFLKELGGGEAEIGVVIGSLSISAILIRPWLGRMMDEKGRRPVIFFGAILNLLATAAYLTVESIGPWIYVIRIIHGFGEAALFSVMFTVAADLVPVTWRLGPCALGLHSSVWRIHSHCFCLTGFEHSHSRKSARARPFQAPWKLDGNLLGTKAGSFVGAYSWF